MNVSTLKVGGKEYPAKWTTNGKSEWEDDTGLLWSDILPSFNDETKAIDPPKVKVNTNQDIKISFYALKEGHRLKGKDFNLTLLDVKDLADLDGFHKQMTSIIFGKPETEKKSEA